MALGTEMEDMRAVPGSALPRARTVGATAMLLLALALLAALMSAPAGATGAPDITFVSPGGLVGGTYQLNVSVEGEVDESSVRWGFTDPPTLTMFRSTGSFFNAEIPLGALKEGTVTVYVRAANLTGTATVVHQSVTVDNTPPAIEMLSGGGYVSGEQVVRARVVDAHLDAPSVVAWLDGSPRAMSREGTSEVFRCPVDTTSLPEGDHTLQVYAKDLVNADYPGMLPNANSSVAVVLHVDNSAPVVEVVWDRPEYVIGAYTVTATVTDTFVDPAHVWVVVDGNTSSPFPMSKEGAVWRCTIDTAMDLMCGVRAFAVEVADLAAHNTRTDAVELKVDNCAPMFMFTSPTGRVAGVYNITLMVEDAFADPSAPVHIIFDGSTVERLEMQCGTDGSFFYRVDTATMTDEDHSVVATTVDLAGHVGTSEPFVLAVDNVEPEFSCLEGGGNVSGAFTFSGLVADPHLNSSSVWAAIFNDTDCEMCREQAVWTGSRFEAYIDTCMMMDGDYAIRLLACDEWDVCHRSEPVPLYVDNNPPQVTVMSKSGTVWGTYKLQVAVVEPHIASVKVRIGGADPVALTFTGTYWERNIDTKTYPDGPLALTVVATDNRGSVNSSAQCSLLVQNRPDLRIERIELERAQVAPGGTVKLRVTVRNSGWNVANGYEVRAVVGARMVANTTEAIGLKANGEKTYVLQWKASGDGVQTVRALVDSANVLDETDEGNNGSTELALTVAKDSPGAGALAAAVAFASLWASARRGRRGHRLH